MPRLTPLVLAAAAALLTAACDRAPAPQSSADATTDSAPWRQPGDVIDSILPMDEQFRRFRADLPEVRTLRGGAPSREALVQRFMTAVEQRDTAAVRDLLMTRAEFAWLYYQHHPFTQKPYEMAPALFWFTLQQNSEKGVSRLFQRYGGQALRYGGHRCDEAETKRFGEGTVYAACTVVHDKPGAGRDTLQLFSGIFELGGVFKFVSYGNAL